MKTCSKCRTLRSRADFNQKPSAKDGLQAWCRGCTTLWSRLTREQKDRAKQWLAVMPRHRTDRGLKRCLKCGRTMPITEFPTCTRDGVSGRCRTCRNNDSAGYRARNPEKAAAAVADWGRRHPEELRNYVHRRRARVTNATSEPFTARDLRHDWEDHDLYGCFFCGGSLVDGYEVEHFYALSNGGPHALFNLVPSCVPCNRGAGGKGTKEPWGFLRTSLAEQGVDLDACFAALDGARRRRG